MDAKIKSGLFYIRPKFTLTSLLPPCQVIDAIQEHMAPGGMVVGNTFGNNATLKIQKRDRSYWSPVVEIHVVKRAKGAVIKGVVGPDSKVWAVFILLNIFAIMLFFVGVLMLIYQWLFGIESYAVWSMPASLFVGLLVMILAKVGQKKGRKQMNVLWQFVEESVREKERNRAEQSGEGPAQGVTV